MVLLQNLTNWCFVVLVIILSKTPLFESVTITLEPDNPTKVLVDSEVVLQWNYSLEAGDRFREVEFTRTRVGADETIGYIDNSGVDDVLLFGQFKGRFEIRKPATLVIYNVTAEDSGEYLLDVKVRISSGAANARSTIVLDVLVPASFISTPADKTINETETVTFFCNASGNPEPTITWLKGGQTVQNGNTLHFTSFRNHSGNYLCSVDNGLNVTVNSSAYLDVQFKPENTRLSVDRSNMSAVLLGSTVVFNCTTSSHPASHVYWFYHNQTLLGSNVTGFYYIQISKSGVYSCMPVNSAGVGESASVDLTVVDPPRVTVSPASLIVLEGNNATLTCNASGIPFPVITWSLPGTSAVLSQNAFFTAVNITRPGTPSEELHYQCTATNGFGNAAVENMTITVHYLPIETSMAMTPSNSTALRGSTVSLNCSTDANPNAHVYQFYFNDTIIGNSSSGVFNVTVEADGGYTCIPINTVGTGHNATVTVTAVDAPSVDVYPTSSIVVEGNNITLSCNASGKPQTVISWTKVGESGPLLSQSSSLVVTNVSRPGTPDNMIQYQCAASNGVESPATAVSNITVHYPPEVMSAPSAQQVIEGNGVILFCNATGNPQPNITWTKQGNNSVLSTSETLNLTNLMRDDNGAVYKCKVQNYLGSVEATAMITVLFPASLISFPTNKTINETDTVTFFCNASGNPEPTITWFKDGQTVGNGNTLSFTGFRNHSGNYLCSADNSLNVTVTASAYLDVQFKPENTHLSVERSNLSAVLLGSTVVFNCTTSSHPASHVYWFYHNQTLLGSNVTGFYNIQISKSGAYSCMPVNSAGDGESASVNLTVVDPPGVTVSPASLIVLEGDNTTLTCNASGIPFPVTTWSLAGTSAVLSQNAVFTAVNITRPGTPSEELHYQCTATNGFGIAAVENVTITVHYPSKIDQAPSNKTMVESNNITLHCNAIGNPAPNITWTKDGSQTVLHHGETYTITNISQQQQGSYNCAAWNNVGQVAKSSFSINVLYGPAISVQQCSSPVTQGSNLTLYCNATGNPVPNIAWIHQDTGIILSSSEQLVLTAVNRRQAGSYQCHVSNGIGSNSTRTCNLDVLYLPIGTSMTMTPSNTTVLRGSNVSLNCSTDANPDAHVYQFYFNDTGIGNSSSGAFNTTIDTDGVYTCVPINTVGTGHNATLSVIAVDAPSIDVYPRSSIVVEGNNITLSCNASGKPQLVLSWIRVGESGQLLSQSSSLVVTNVSRPGTPDNMIQYQCTASNGVESPATAVSNITVHYPPEIVSAPSAQQVIEGNGVILFCNATGNPQPNITWTKQGNNSVLSPLETLNLTNLMRDDNGTVYICKVQNYLGSVKATALITVLYPPAVKIQQCSTSVTEGDNVTFYCNATGNPVPNISWIRASTAQVLSSNEMLVIQSIKRNESGSYQCLVWNGIGNNSTNSCTIDVQYKPTGSALTTTPSNTTVLRGFPVSLNCSTDANPDAHVYQFYFNDTIIGNGSSGVFNVTVEADGGYTCVPINTVGTGHNASVSVTAVVAPVVNVIPQTDAIVEGGNITLTCNTSGIPSPLIRWERIGQSGVLSQTSSLTVVNVNRPGTPDNMIQYQCTASNGVESPATAVANVSIHYVPAIVIAPSNTTIVEGNNAVLFCNATGSPKPNVTWTKAGRNLTVSSSEILRLDNVTREDDEAEYKCIITNYLGSLEASAVVSVHYPSTIVSSPVKSTFLEGSNATLHCNATGNPTPNITWTKDGGQTVLYQGETYSISNIQRQAAGDYTCTAWNGVGEHTNVTATVTVHYESVIDVVPSNMTVVEGENVTLHCNATGNPLPNITWTKDGSPAVLYQGETYSIVTIQRQAAGDYTCTAWNGVVQRANATATVTVHYKPTGSGLTATPSDTTVLRGSPVSLNCSTVANPDAHVYQFYFNDTIIGNSSSGVFNVTVKADGVYTCVPINTVGTGHNATVSVTVVVAPVVEVIPRTDTVVEGGNITLTCNTSSIPSPLIRWERIGQSGVLSQTSSLTVVNVSRPGTPDNMIQYQCTASNGVESPATAVSNITVHYVPAVNVIAPSNTTIVEGNNAVLFCNATGNPKPNVTWTKAGENTTVSSSEVLRLDNLTRKDDGREYKCIITNYLGSVEASAVVSVHYPSTIVSSPVNSTFLEGSNVTLHCNATGNPTTNITWSKDGSPTVLYQGETYSISNIQRQAAGDYTCTAWNGVGESTNATATFAVYYPPLVKGSPSNIVVIDGDNVTLQCNITGNPTPVVTWTKDSNATVLNTGESFTIYSITQQQAGDYICSARNEIDKANATVKVTVHYPSSVDTGPVSQTVLEGSNFTLHCNATGNPTPNITWSKDGSPTVLYQGEMYSISNIQRQAAGDYTCTAWNGVGEQTNATATITVHYPAVIHDAPSNKSVLEYSNVTFFCNATSNPPSHIIWTRDGNNAVLHHGNSFVIRSVSRNYNGQRYKCTARNNVTQDVHSFAHVTVLYSPGVFITAISPVLEGKNMSLKCLVDGNPPPNVAWIKGSDNSVIANSSTALVTNIQRNYSGLFYCVAWNGIGANASSNISVDVLYPPEIVARPEDQVVWVGQQVNIPCEATGNPVPKIVYTVVGQNGTVGSGKTLVINSSSTPYVKTYTCNARNGINPQASANATVTVLVRPCSQNPCLKGSCTDVRGTKYLCDCSYGYQGNNCDDPITPKTDSVDGQVTLNKDQYQYHEDYQNHSSAMFRDLSTQFSENISALYKDEPQYGHIKVNSIINGSVVVNFTLVFIKGKKTVEELVQVLKGSVNKGSIFLIPVERETLRLDLPPTAAPPTTVTAQPPSEAARQKALASWIIALLCAIGGLVILVLTCAIIHCCVQKKRKARKQDICQRYEESTGKWIDLPDMTNGKGSTESDYTYVGPQAYVEEGPTVKEQTDQKNGFSNGIYERSPDERRASAVRFCGQAAEDEGNTTTL